MMTEPPDDEAPQIVMAHGGGGELTRRLLAEHVFPKLANDLLDPLTDSAILPRPGGRICLTTDAFVVVPLEFPGGDIGRLAVCGTVNDLAMAGARPLYLSLALIIEEGLPQSELKRVVSSIQEAAREARITPAELKGYLKLGSRLDDEGRSAILEEVAARQPLTLFREMAPLVEKASGGEELAVKRAQFVKFPEDPEHDAALELMASTPGLLFSEAIERVRRQAAAKS